MESTNSMLNQDMINNLEIIKNNNLTRTKEQSKKKKKQNVKGK